MPTLRGSLLALFVSIVLVAAVLYGVVPGIITVGGWFELLFTNTLGMPFNTGTILYILLLIGSFVWAIYETYKNSNGKRENIAFLIAFALIGIPFYGYGWSAFIIGIIIIGVLYFVLNMKKNKVALVSSRVKNTALLCMLMLIIGYSSYALIVIRSTANPPMDQNSPEDIFTLGNYLSRNQYGDYPLLYGQAYTSEPAVAADGMHYDFKEGAPIYQQKEKATKGEKDSYFIVRHKSTQLFEQNMFFPRMYDAAHASHYEQWMGGIEGHDVDGVKMPTQLENIKFFISYQCNFMYWRYFMWNFVGSAERHARQRRTRTRQLDHRNIIHRQHALRRSEHDARRTENQQGTQRLLRATPVARTPRPLLASLQRKARHTAMLGGALPIHHDRIGHRRLSQPDTRTTP